MISKENILVLLLLSIPVAFIVGIYWNKNIDYSSETAQIMYCGDYSERFLDFFGYDATNKKEECQNLNLALHGQVLDDCNKLLGSTGSLSEKQYNLLVDQCVYFELSKNVGLLRAKALIEFQNQYAESAYSGF